MRICSAGQRRRAQALFQTEANFVDHLYGRSRSKYQVLDHQQRISGGNVDFAGDVSNRGMQRAGHHQLLLSPAHDSYSRGETE